MPRKVLGRIIDKIIALQIFFAFSYFMNSIPDCRVKLCIGMFFPIVFDGLQITYSLGNTTLTG